MAGKRQAEIREEMMVGMAREEQEVVVASEMVYVGRDRIKPGSPGGAMMV